jgi:hypothetical protein
MANCRLSKYSSKFISNYAINIYYIINNYTTVLFNIILLMKNLIKLTILSNALKNADKLSFNISSRIASSRKARMNSCRNYKISSIREKG